MGTKEGNGVQESIGLLSAERKASLGDHNSRFLGVKHHVVPFVHLPTGIPLTDIVCWSVNALNLCKPLRQSRLLPFSLNERPPPQNQIKQEREGHDHPEGDRMKAGRNRAVLGMHRKKGWGKWKPSR